MSIWDPSPWAEEMAELLQGLEVRCQIYYAMVASNRIAKYLDTPSRELLSALNEGAEKIICNQEVDWEKVRGVYEDFARLRARLQVPPITEYAISLNSAMLLGETLLAFKTAPAEVAEAAAFVSDYACALNEERETLVQFFEHLNAVPMNDPPATVFGRLRTIGDSLPAFGAKLLTGYSA